MALGYKVQYQHMSISQAIQSMRNAKKYRPLPNSLMQDLEGRSRGGICGVGDASSTNAGFPLALAALLLPPNTFLCRTDGIRISGAPADVVPLRVQALSREHAPACRRTSIIVAPGLRDEFRCPHGHTKQLLHASLSTATPT